jgi:hypothetical protein
VTATLANSKLQTLICGLLLCMSGTAVAETDEDEGPDMEFLEYLGLWEESDEDWLLIEEEVVAENDERSDPVPDGEESVETEDES